MPVSTRTLALLALGSFAALVGAGIQTASYAEITSYFSDEAEACANCHVMTEQFDAWQRGSHREVATCNDCHTPADFVGKWLTKGINGWNHSLAFTTGNFPEHIRITERNRAITEATCRDCHARMVEELEHPGAEPIDCVRCHADVGHLH